MTATEYDSLGRLHRTSQPYLTSTSETPMWTTTDYDLLNRPQTMTQDLGIITDDVAASSAQETMLYEGRAVLTTKYLGNGETRTRLEEKNISGKVSRVVDGLGTAQYFRFDPDGNLRDASTLRTFTPGPQTVHYEYDVRGRRIHSQDPDMGTWDYHYDGFGQVTLQTDGKGQDTTMTYDSLGRMLTRTNADGTAQWVYDIGVGAGIGKLASSISPPDTRLVGPCTIPYTTVTDGNRAGQWLTYTTTGEVSEVFECTDGETFSTQFDYDSFGRQQVVRYPAIAGTRLALRNNYSAAGYLRYVDEDATDNSVYWQAESMDASGRVTLEITRNGVETVSTLSAGTGWLRDSQSTALADGGDVDPAPPLQFRRGGEPAWPIAQRRARSRRHHRNVHLRRVGSRAHRAGDHDPGLLVDV